MELSKKRLIYVIAIAAVLIGLLIASLLSIADLGYEEKEDVIFAIMFFGVPFGALLVDLLNLLRFDKYKSKGQFLLKNMLLVLALSYVTECIVVFAGFGLERPQYKLLYTFAIGGAVASAILSLLTTGFYPMGKKKRKK